MYKTDYDIYDRNNWHLVSAPYCKGSQLTSRSVPQVYDNANKSEYSHQSTNENAGKSMGGTPADMKFTIADSINKYNFLIKLIGQRISSIHKFLKRTR